MRAYYYGRFSQGKQAKGTSFDRQLELPQGWCKRKRIPLDETLSYFDKGRSGYHGHHRRKGAGLALFLAACEAGRVKPGSYLLVESLDRLSREQLHVFQELIHRLLFKYRIKLVVLFGEIEFTAENYETTHWLIDAEAQRAHSESRTKSIRSKDNWERRRKLAVVTRKTPSWIRFTDGKFVLVEAKAAAVRRIFALACTGHGFASICRTLTREKVKPISNDTFWRPSYVEKVLKSRTVIGEFQPRKIEDGKRVPAGPVRGHYFPAAVTRKQFLDAQAAMAARLVRRGRSEGEKVSNLFTGLNYRVADDVHDTGEVARTVEGDRRCR